MAEQVTLTVVDGVDDLSSEYVFKDRTLCTVGRSSSSYLQLDDCYVSRHHCLFDIDPPLVRLRDTGSRNGTYVNGELIGRRLPDENDTLADAEDIILHDGDEVQLGSILLRVAVEPVVEKADSGPSEIRELATV